MRLFTIGHSKFQLDGYFRVILTLRLGNGRSFTVDFPGLDGDSFATISSKLLRD